MSDTDRDDAGLEEAAEKAALTWVRPDVEAPLVRRVAHGPRSADLVALVARLSAALQQSSLIAVLDDEREYCLAAHDVPVAAGRLLDGSAGEGLARASCATRESVVLEDASTDPFLGSHPLSRSGALRSFVSAPIVVEGVTVGAAVCFGPSVRAFSAADVMLVEMVAAEASRILTPLLLSEEPTADPTTSEANGRFIDGRWQLFRRLGRGGQADVYLAVEVHSGHQVAIKLGTTAGAGVLEEARGFGSVRHTNLVNIHAAGKLPDGREYAVMEYVEGPPFAMTLRHDDTLSVPRLLSGLACLAGAVTALHAVGIAHGDIKPSNILYDIVRDRPVLIDLGLGIRLGEAMRVLGGTPGLSAPEQFDPDLPPITRAADVYGLAAAAWKLITGSGPFANHKGSAATLEAQRSGPDLRLPPSCAGIEEVLLRALSPRPEARPGSPVELVLELGAAANGVTQVVWPLDGVSTEVLHLLLAEVRRTADAPELVEWEERLAQSGTYAPLADLGRLLRVAARGSLPHLERMTRAMVRRRGRSRLLAAHVAMDPWSILEALHGIHSHFIPGLRLRTARIEGRGACLELDLPPEEALELRVYLHTVYEEMLIHAGVRAAMEWTRVTEARWSASVTWSSVGG